MNTKWRSVRFVEPCSKRHAAYDHWLKQWPLMGPILLGTMLSRRGHDVRIYNENLSGSVLADDAILADLLDADVVGISIMTSTAARGYALADAIRAHRPRGKVVIGGAHATFMPDEAAQHADQVVVGEAENVIADLVEGRADAPIVHGAPLEDMDVLPTPDYELIHDHRLLWHTAGSQAVYRAPLVTSRGCPYNCRYCSVTKMFGSRYRARSPERVIQDVQALHDKGYRGVFFYDDNFTADRQRTRRILNGLKELGIAWNAQTRLDFHWRDRKTRQRCDHDLLRLMKGTGGDVLYIGY